MNDKRAGTQEASPPSGSTFVGDILHDCRASADELRKHVESFEIERDRHATLVAAVREQLGVSARMEARLQKVVADNEKLVTDFNTVSIGHAKLRDENQVLAAECSKLRQDVRANESVVATLQGQLAERDSRIEGLAKKERELTAKAMELTDLKAAWNDSAKLMERLKDFMSPKSAS